MFLFKDQVIKIISVFFFFSPQVNVWRLRRNRACPTSFDNTNRHSPRKRNGTPSLVAHRPLKERVIHVRALKPLQQARTTALAGEGESQPQGQGRLDTVLDWGKTQVHGMLQHKCTTNKIFTIYINAKMFPNLSWNLMRVFHIRVLFSINYYSFKIVKIWCSHTSEKKKNVCKMVYTVCV